MNETALVTTDSTLAIMPVMDMRLAVMRRQALVDFTKSIMIEGSDYGVVPGTGSKPSLLKPGAEKLSSFFGLVPIFEDMETVEDWTGKDHGEPFFFYRQKCKLYRGSMLVATADGSCNSWEKKYRYRNGERVCPSCGKPAIKRSKFPPRNRQLGSEPGWYCFDKAGGCGMEFAANDSAITGQQLGQVTNQDVAEQVNTILKMAQKRALVAAVLIGVNASEFFTQDIEDMDFGPVIDVTPPPKPETGNGQPGQPMPRSPREIATQDATQFVAQLCVETGWTENEARAAAKGLGMNGTGKTTPEREARWNTLVTYHDLTAKDGLTHDAALAVINGAMSLDAARNATPKQAELIHNDTGYRD